MYISKKTEKGFTAAANEQPQRKAEISTGFRVVNNRPEAVTQRKIQEMVNAGASTIQRRAAGKTSEADALQATLKAASDKVTDQDVANATESVDKEIAFHYNRGQEAFKQGGGAKQQGHKGNTDDFHTRCFNDGFNDARRELEAGNRSTAAAEGSASGTVTVGGGGAAATAAAGTVAPAAKASREIKQGHADKTGSERSERIERRARTYAQERFQKELIDLRAKRAEVMQLIKKSE